MPEIHGNFLKQHVFKYIQGYYYLKHGGKPMSFYGSSKTADDCRAYNAFRNHASAQQQKNALNTYGRYNSLKGTMSRYHLDNDTFERQST